MSVESSRLIPLAPRIFSIRMQNSPNLPAYRCSVHPLRLPSPPLLPPLLSRSAVMSLKKFRTWFYISHECGNPPTKARRTNAHAGGVIPRMTSRADNYNRPARPAAGIRVKRRALWAIADKLRNVSLVMSRLQATLHRDPVTRRVMGDQAGS